ncbi:Delta(6)-fatty-acid desaturase fat-3 [Orchesella cincta]|uniref:Delta(6)-fatty-acid desaturase fat-3 n=1 Tax=Orchesella cincta TaxID=48709 RepID=A0A1D2M5B9_ORCCI|nr:Delta(6)-fatty-acid desaturase fat-3 [Orchesella cincta]
MNHGTSSGSKAAKLRVKRHPGGRIIEFYTKSGRRCYTSHSTVSSAFGKESQGYHELSKAKPAELHELGLEPQVLKRHQALTEDFQKLYRDLESEGYFTPSLPTLYIELAELVIWQL